MKLKLFIVFSLLIIELGYMAKMVIESNDPAVLEKVLQVPVIGEMVYENRISPTRTMAQGGDIHSMMALYHMAIDLENDEEKKLAHKLLWNSGSPTAQIFLFHQDGGNLEKMQTRDFMLLEARAMKENIRPYLKRGDMNRAYTQQTRWYAASIEALYKRAERGDRDARWVVQQLEKDEELTS